MTAGGGRALVPKALAAALVLAVGSAVNPLGPSPDDRTALTAGLAFEISELEPPVGLERSDDNLRVVHPDLEHIRSWISAVGASAALSDVSGNGLPDDLCLVDPRVDVPVLMSLEAPAAYDPVVLEVERLPYDEDTTAPMGCVLGDLNASGRTDLLVYYWGRSPVLFLQDSDTAGAVSRSSFSERELADPPEVWNTNAVALADVDGSGAIDVIVGNYFPDGAPILDGQAGSDPRVQMQDSMSYALNGGRSRLLRNLSAESDGPLAFEEVADAFPGDLGTGWTLAVGAVDLDGDLLPEVYLANDFGHDRLLHNRSEPGDIRLELVEGRRGLTTPRSKALGRGSFKGMAIDFADVDRSGHLDLFVSNIATDFGLHESHHLFVHSGDTAAFAAGRAPFTDESERLGVARSGWGWDAKAADLDNSGQVEIVQATGFLRGERNRWPELQELALANDRLLRVAGVWPRFRPGDDLSGEEPNAVFVRDDGGRFLDLAADLGLGAPYVSRGIAVADLDGDGRLDLVFANQWEPSVLLRNACEDCGRFLGLDLLLPTGPNGGETLVRPGRQGADVDGRPALGAQVLVRTDRGVRLAHVDGASGHSGQREPAIHLGLGDETVEKVEVRYRDGDGVARRVTLDVEEGWHTVVLGSDAEALR